MHELIWRRFYESETRPLTLSQVKSLREAIDGLRTVLSFEDKFYIVMENFLELELCLASTAARHMLRPLLKDEEFGDRLREANRRIVNLLTSFRLYRDQSVHHLGPILSGCDLRARFEDEQKNLLAFRVIEGLRNHVQHRGLPIHTMTLGSSWADGAPKSGLRYHTRLAINLSQLEDDERFPKSVIAELKALPEVPDLSLLLREYASAIAKIHDHLRKSLARSQADWTALVNAANSGWGSREDDVDQGLVVAEVNGDDSRTVLFEIYAGSVSMVEDLQRRNFCMTALERAFFTSEIA